jgi:hypothetical protein
VGAIFSKVSLFLQFILLFKKKIKKNFIVHVNHFCLWKMTIVLTRRMKKQMNEAMQWEGGDVPSTGQRQQFHTIDWEGLATLHIVE